MSYDPIATQFMSIEDPKIIDFVSTVDDPKRAVLTIVDHLDWQTESHLRMLQDKINLYIACADSGEVFQKFPALLGLPIEIEIRHLFDLDDKARRFIARTSEELTALGFIFSAKKIRKK